MISPQYIMTNISILRKVNSSMDYSLAVKLESSTNSTEGHPKLITYVALILWIFNQTLLKPYLKVYYLYKLQVGFRSEV